MLEDKTYKIKVADYHDAVIYVYERHVKCLNPDEEDAEKKKVEALERDSDSDTCLYGSMRTTKIDQVTFTTT